MLLVFKEYIHHNKSVDDGNTGGTSTVEEFYFKQHVVIWFRISAQWDSRSRRDQYDQAYPIKSNIRFFYLRLGLADSSNGSR